MQQPKIINGGSAGNEEGVLFGLPVEGLLAPSAAKIDRGSLVLGLKLRGVGIDLQAANGIFGFLGCNGRC
jgi:hypothetical protein